MKLFLLATVTMLTLVACDKSPTVPGPTYPAVAGNYSGTATITSADGSSQVTCAASAVVTQSGSSVTVGPMTLGDMTDGTVSCADVGSLAIGQFTIDTTGAMVAYNTGTFTEPSCAPFRLSGTGGFAGNQFGASLNATAPSGSGGDCGAFNLTATLTH